MDFDNLEFFDTDGDFNDAGTEAAAIAAEEADKNADKKKVVNKDPSDLDIVDFDDLEGADIDEDIVKDIDDKSRADKSSSSSSDNLYLNLAKALSEKGIIEDFDDSLFNDEGVVPTEVLMNLVKATVDSNVNEYKNVVSGDRYEALKALERGDSIDGYLNSKNKALELNKITKDTLEDESKANVRADLIRSYYKQTTNLSDARINKNIQRMIDLGEDVDESKSMLVELQEMEDNRAAESLAAQEQKRIDSENSFKENLNKLRDEVDNIDLSFLGSKASKKTRDKIYTMLTKPVSAERQYNAVTAKRNELGAGKFDIILASLINKGVFDGDLSKLSNKQRRTALSELENSIERSDFSTGHGGNFGGSDGSTADSIFSRRR